MRFIRFIALVLIAVMLASSAGQAETPADSLRNAQIRLGALGFYPYEPSGETDEATIIAISNFQRANGIPVTGSADPATLERLFSEEAVSKEAFLKTAGNITRVDVSLKKGDNGKKVKSLQEYLIKLGYLAGEADGDYKDGTMRAVALFQAVNGLTITGQADADTVSLMASTLAIPAAGFDALAELSYGSDGILVKQLQIFLKNSGFFTGECTGVFGRKTQEAVIKFQQRNGLEETGRWDILLFATISSGAYTDKAASEAKEAALVLGSGDSGYLVSEIENRLVALGYLQTADDQYDDKTEKALKLFQEACGIEPTGKADSITRGTLTDPEAPTMDEFNTRCLNCTLLPGDTGYAVYLLTNRLFVLGYDVLPGYEYDETVSEAVRFFRKANGLTDGNVADNEMRALLNGSSAMSYIRAEQIYNEISETEGYARRYAVLLETAQQCVGKPYEAGKVGPDSFGAGGLIYYCFSCAEFELAPTVSLQMENAAAEEAFTMDAEAVIPGGQMFFRAGESLYTAVVIENGLAVYVIPEDGTVKADTVETLLQRYEFAGYINYISPA